MKRPRWTLRSAMILNAALAVLMGTLVAIATALQGSNCGGNSMALNNCRLYLLVVSGAAATSPDRRFDIATATAEQREELSRIADDLLWGSFLVSPWPYRAHQSGPRRILIVCDRPFRNVPRRILGTAPPTHAAGFSDGTVELISVADFEALDHSSLVPLDELLAATGPRMLASGPAEVVDSDPQPTRTPRPRSRSS